MSISNGDQHPIIQIILATQLREGQWLTASRIDDMSDSITEVLLQEHSVPFQDDIEN